MASHPGTTPASLLRTARRRYTALNDFVGQDRHGHPESMASWIGTLPRAVGAATPASARQAKPLIALLRGYRGPPGAGQRSASVMDRPS